MVDENSVAKIITFVNRSAIPGLVENEVSFSKSEMN